MDHALSHKVATPEAPDRRGGGPPRDAGAAPSVGFRLELLRPRSEEAPATSSESLHAHAPGQGVVHHLRGLPRRRRRRPSRELSKRSPSEF